MGIRKKPPRARARGSAAGSGVPGSREKSQSGPRAWTVDGIPVEVESGEPGPLLLKGLPAPRKQLRMS